MGLKLRNKKTGEIVEWLTLKLMDLNEIEFDYVDVRGHKRSWSYSSLEKFNEEWEDYEPEEPKITDPEWRHIVRKWYELNDLEGKLRVVVDPKNYKIIGWRKEEELYGQEIDIPLSVMECDKDIRRSFHTITGLCGAPEPLEPTFIDLDERIKEKEEEQATPIERYVKDYTEIYGEEEDEATQ